MFSCLNANSSSEWTAWRILHTPLIWLTVFFVLANHKQFIRVNRMLYIAHTFIWLPVSFVLLITNSSSEWTVCCVSHTLSSGCLFLLFLLIANSYLNWTICPSSHTQLKSEPCLMHPPSQTFCSFFDGFLHPRLRLVHRTQFRRRVSDRSVALAASCISAYYVYKYH